MSNDKQTTAVQWLMSFIEPSLTDEQKQFFSLLIKQAKERERQQIEDAYDSAIMKGRQEDGKQYFDETFTQ